MMKLTNYTKWLENDKNNRYYYMVYGGFKNPHYLY
jgi:hypothetical protein